MTDFIQNGMVFKTLQNGDEIADVFGNDHYNFSNLKQDGIVIDLGANIGGFSIRAAVEKNCTCFAYEPSKKTYSVLLENIEKNKVQNKIKAFNNAIFSAAETKDYFFYSAHPAGSSLIDNGISEKETINCITIADVFENNNIKECDFLKMDIEGAEQYVFIPKFLKYLNKCKIISFEFHNTSLLYQICELMVDSFDVGDYKGCAYEGGPYTIVRKA